MRRQSKTGWALAAPFKAFLVLAAAAWALGAAVQPAQARTPDVADSKAQHPVQSAAAATVALATLPVQAQQTYQLILKGGPFPYDKDATVFFNRERLLPKKARGHYREYTVKTPGVRTRGARRIVCGGEPPSQPEVCFYTADHYASFNRIVP